MMVMESDTLGMTVIEETSSSSQIEEIRVDEWVEMISSKKLDGFPYNRIYYSFLKGIPTIMYIYAKEGE